MSEPGVLVRVPGSLKRAIVREVALRQSNLNDVVVALLAERSGAFRSRPGVRRHNAIPGATGAVSARRREPKERTAREAKSAHWT